MSSSPSKLRIDAPTPPEADSRATDAKRRGFLVALGAGGIGAAAIVIRSVPPAAPVAASGGTAATSGEGYRLTDHVKRYYRTTKT